MDADSSSRDLERFGGDASEYKPKAAADAPLSAAQIAWLRDHVNYPHCRIDGKRAEPIGFEGDVVRFECADHRERPIYILARGLPA